MEELEKNINKRKIYISLLVSAGTSLIIGTQNTKVLDNKHNWYIVKEVGLNS